MDNAQDARLNLEGSHVAVTNSGYVLKLDPNGNPILPEIGETIERLPSEVIDCFAGVGLGALDALTMGLNWTGIELEPRFVALAQENIALWDKRYKGRLPRWGTAQILQGDSRHLLDVIAGAGAAVSSPPYANATKNLDDIDKWNPEKAARIKDMQSMSKSMMRPYSTDPQNLGNLREGDVQSVIASPPYAGSINTPDDTVKRANRMLAKGITKMGHVRVHNEGLDNMTAGTIGGFNTTYGKTDGQLGSMPEGVISSPPYSAARVGDECGQAHVGRNGNYGTTAGQLGAMAEGVVSSPPYIPKSDRRVAWGHDHEALQREDERRGHAPVTTFRGSYSNNPDNLGNPTGANQETFWGAARVIVSQAYAALAPGAHAAWVLKAFVRNKAIVDFPAQWQQLCESVGFETVAIARAWQTKDDGTQLATDGNHKRLTKERKGFFRRLHEKKYPDTKIDFEIVLFQVKP